MADYAVLIAHLRDKYNTNRAVVFGGSYGGMLAAWMRLSYPNLVNGAIASSAPIGCLDPNYQGSSYWRVVTQTAGTSCANKVYAAFSELFKRANTAPGRLQLQEMFRLCAPLTVDNVESFGLFVQGAFDAMAMGDYPFPTSYISGNPAYPAPAWPMKVACNLMSNSRFLPSSLMFCCCISE